MNEISPLTRSEMLKHATSAVAKIDLLGPRGTTLCSMIEIEAMAALIVASGALTDNWSAACREAELEEQLKEQNPMITMTTTLTGYQVGEALAGDAEELAYCLTELASDLPLGDFPVVADHVDNPEIVGLFLRALADKIDPPKEQYT